MKAALFRFLFPGKSIVDTTALANFLELSDQLAGGLQGLAAEAPRRTIKRRSQYWALRTEFLG